MPTAKHRIVAMANLYISLEWHKAHAIVGVLPIQAKLGNFSWNKNSLEFAADLKYLTHLAKNLISYGNIRTSVSKIY